MNPPSHTRRSADEWRSLVEQQRRSNQTQAAFCRERGVSLSSFGYWRRKLGSPTSTGTQGDKDPPLWIEWPATVDRQPSPRATSEAPGWDLELDLGNGLQLRLRHVVS